MRTLSVIVYSIMVISFGVIHQCAMQVVKMSRELNDNGLKPKVGLCVLKGASPFQNR